MSLAAMYLTILLTKLSRMTGASPIKSESKIAIYHITVNALFNALTCSEFSMTFDAL